MSREPNPMSGCLPPYGKRGNPTRNAWREMWKRCTNPRSKSFAWYGARGIAVCERWRSFENFLADMGPRPLGLSLDRVDNDRGYEPGNCRWATASEQANNTRRTVRITAEGVTLPRSVWVRRSGLSLSTVRHRVAAGWTAEEALGTGPLARPRTSKLTAGTVRAARDRNSQGVSVYTLAAEAGVSVPTMWKAIVGKTWRTA
jgi:hypothetical protein